MTAAAVRALHQRAATPRRAYDLDLRCDAHTGPPPRGAGATLEYLDAIENCPMCGFREQYVCVHCSCPNDVWPCPTIRALDDRE